MLLLIALVPFYNGWDAYGLTSSESVTLQVQLILMMDGDYIDGENDVTISLTGDAGAIWSKTFYSETLTDGVLSTELSGEDDSGYELIASMFDEEDIQLEVDIGGTTVSLDLVTQPYAIKSRISDMSHDTEGIQGIDVQYVETVNDGDVLTIKDGIWVPTAEDDGLTGVVESSSASIKMDDLEDVEVAGVIGLEDGHLLKWDSTQWVNTSDMVLSDEEVEAIADEAGYLKALTISDVVTGNYDQITGIGGELTIEEDTVSIANDMEVLGNIEVMDMWEVHKPQ